MFPLSTSATWRTALRGLVAAVLVIALCPAGARAELVTQQFSGTVTAVSDTTNGRIDLTGVFSVGMSFTASYTIERATAPSYSDANQADYAQLVTAFSFTLGSYYGSASFPYSSASVYNDVPPFSKLPSTRGTASDSYRIGADAQTTLPQFGATFIEVVAGLDDLDGTAFDSTALPRLLPDLTVFEDKGAVLNVRPVGQGNFGTVICSITGETTPALGASWGSVKGRYRE